ncbi:RNA-directed DNA polymerase-like protein [Gossypium australe]|uniref:RNA-directed DNA polymerase-like protein n=1 Tax=Gossypium australe TaxID=47621 RepID=A0A5B6UWH2_9ROSI|nr:RNA-directed DNA polymerase-like protein [Gossypium australe]
MTLMEANPTSYVQPARFELLELKVQAFAQQKLLIEEPTKLKLKLDARIIYPILDSLWVSLVQCVPKKGGITIVEDKRNKLTPKRTITGWRICIDYRKLKKVTRKECFPPPFMD